MQKNQLLIVTGFLAIGLFLTSCGNSSSKNNPQNPVPVPHQLSFPRDVSFQGSNCTTARANVADMTQYCSYLRDETRHNNCAKAERDLEASRYCGGTPSAPYTPGNANDLEKNRNPRGQEIENKQRRGNNSQNSVLYTCSAWAQSQSSKKVLGGLFNFNRNKVVPTSSSFGWDGRKTIKRKLNLASAKSEFGQISIEMSPAKGKDLEPMVKLSVEGYDRSQNVSVKGYADQKIYLEITEDEMDGRISKFLHVECSPSSLNVARRTVIGPVDCAGTAQDTGKDEKNEFEMTIPTTELRNSTALLDGDYDAFVELLFNAYKGAQAGDESMMVNFTARKNSRGFEFGSNLHAPLEITYADKSQRSPSMLELKCSTRR